VKIKEALGAQKVKFLKGRKKTRGGFYMFRTLGVSPQNLPDPNPERLGRFDGCFKTRSYLFFHNFKKGVVHHRAGKR